MEKILTIVVPTYNMEKYLDKCLSSLIVDDRELMSRFEVLVIIDGATDKSSEIAHRYESNYSETFRVIDKENGNYGSCINRGLKEASGKYIKVLDADDWFCTETFEKYLKIIQDCDADLVLNDCHTVEQNIEYNTFDIASGFSDNEIYNFDKLKSRYLPMHCLAYKLENLKGISYRQTEGISYTDAEWHFTPMTTVKTFIAVPGALYLYFIGRIEQTVNPAILLSKLDDLSAMLKSLVYRKELFSGDQIYQDYLDFTLRAHLDVLYHSMPLKRQVVEHIKLVDQYILKQSPSYYHSMDNWCDNNQVFYIGLIRHPLHTLISIFLHKGYSSFAANLFFVKENDLLPITRLLNLIYRLKHSFDRN